MRLHLRNPKVVFALQVFEHFGLIFWLGTTYAISLLALPKAFALLPREQAGTYAQGIFPAMNVFTALSLGVVITCHLLLRSSQRTPATRKKGVLLFLCAGLLGFNALVIQPAVHTLRGERQDPIKNQRFRIFHGASMVGNLVIMLLGVPIVVWTTAQNARRKDATGEPPIPL